MERRPVVKTLSCQFEELSNVIGCLVGIELNNEGARRGFHNSLKIFWAFLLGH
jgi:hypothetical protein